MIEVNEALTRKTADLARLELTDTEAQLFTQQLAVILKHVDQLQEAQVGQVEPLYQPFEVAPLLREDVPIASPSYDGKPKTLRGAPEVMHDGFKVPPIL